MGAGRTSAPPADVAAFLRDAAMAGEADRYIAATLAPPAACTGLAAVAAFAAELARIPAGVSEPMLGSIRLQWWRDALAAGRTGTRSGNPVADAFIEASRRHGLGAAGPAAMLEAREHDLSGAIFADDRALLAYLDAIEGSAFRLSLAVLGLAGDDSGPVATAAGRAYGLARALGRLPMLLHNGGLPLTAERLRRAGIEPDALAASPVASATAAAVATVGADLADLARAEKARALSGLAAMPRAARAALLPLAMVEPYFRAQRPGARLDRMAGVSPLSRVVALGLARLTGRL